ncbi:hypothetical protein [Streptomyces sp. NPDC004230]
MPAPERPTPAPERPRLPVGLRIYLACVFGTIAHVAYGVLCKTMKPSPTGCASTFAPFQSWGSTGVLVVFLLIFNLAAFTMVNTYVKAAPTAQMLIALGAGWSLWGLVSPFLA